MNVPYINTSFLRGFSSLVLAKSGNLSELYESVGLDKELFIEESLQRVSLKSLLIPFDKFIYLLEATAVKLDFPDIAMQLARQQDIMILAPVGPKLNRCSTVLEALEIIIKYLKLLVSGYQIELQTQHDSLTLTFSLDLPHVQEMIQYQDYAVASAVSVLHELLGKSHPIRACYFLRSERNQKRISEYSNYFGCPVTFNSRTLSLAVDSSILQQDIGPLVKQINAKINHALMSYSEGIVDQVTKVISFSLANGNSNIKDIASSMNYSQRTLQRKLSQQNTSYSALLDSVRFNLANQYLTNTYYRLTDIAALLDYSDLSSFSRSYYRWCGIYPLEYRKQLQLSLLRFTSH